MKIAVVGAGISGLTVANLLSASGHQVKVFDSAQKLEPVGAGFTLQPPGLAVLENLGLLGEVETCSAHIGTSSIFDPNGRRSSFDIMGSLSGSNASYSIHRGDFHSILHTRVVQSCELRHPVRIIDVEASERTARIQIEGTGYEEFDLLIGADGVRSGIRRYVDPAAVLQLSHGVAVRSLVPKEQCDELQPNFRAWMGKGKVILTYPVRSGSWINIASYQHGPEEEQDTWSNPYCPNCLRRDYAGWDPVLGELLSRVQTSFSWKLVDMQPLSDLSKGRVVLIGDAAHPMLPYLGQGANQSIADAESLARNLRTADSNNASIREAVRNYEEERRLPTARIQHASRIAGRIFKQDFPAGWKEKERAIRDAIS